MMHQSIDKTIDQAVQDSLAVVDHHFDIHEHCGEWCTQKNMKPDEKAATAHRYCNKTQDGLLYKQLHDAVKKYFNSSNAAAVMHRFSTQKSESMNECIRQLCPKHKTYCKSRAMIGRVCAAIGINVAGPDGFYLAVVEEAGIQSSEYFKFFLQNKQKMRKQKQQYKRSAAAKKKRKAAFYERAKKLLEELAKAKHDVDYGRGIGMELEVIDVEENDTNNQTDDTATKGNEPSTEPSYERTPTKPKKKEKICERCRKKGHKTWRSKHCTYHEQYLTFKSQSCDKMVNSLLSSDPEESESSENDENSNRSEFVDKQEFREVLAGLESSSNFKKLSNIEDDE